MKSFSIVSAYKSGLSEVENLARHREMLSALRVLIGSESFKEAEGSYNGQYEKSALIFGNADWIAQRLMDYYEQECFLSVRRTGQAHLVFPYNARRYAGKWLEIDAPHGNSWTKIDGKYFVTQKDKL